MTIKSSKVRQHQDRTRKVKIKSLSFRQNSLLNLTGGGVMALYAFLSPLVLARALDPQSYSAYVLGLQLVPFLLLLATPVQASIGPKFARYRAAGANFSTEVSSLAAVAARSFLVIALIAIVAAVSLSFILPVILAWDTAFASIGSQAIRYLGLAAALSMPALIFTSYAAGHRNFLWENILKCVGPYLGLVLVFAAWQLVPNLQGRLSAQWVVGLSALSTVLGALFVICLGLRQPFPRKIRWFHTHPFGMRELIKESGGTYWWQVCALLSVGTGPFLVSRVDLDSVAAYAIAVSTMTVITGVSTAFSGPFTIQIAQSSLKTDIQRVDDFRRFHDRFMIFVCVATIVILAVPQPVFDLWLGESLGRAVSRLLIPLAIANLLRQITSPYTAAVLGLGKQSKIWLSPAVEAVLSILLGLLLGHAYGSQGVAYGLLMAALVRLIVTLFYDLRLTRTVLLLSALHLLVPRMVRPNSHSKT
jgi:O-antigen/teichoic acid export membrane protein